MATLILRPYAIGDLTEIPVQYPVTGAHWDKVDDVSPDDDATFVHENRQCGFGETYDTKDLYEIPSIDIGGAVINSVTVWIRTKVRYASSTSQLIKTHGTVYMSGLGHSPAAWADDGETWNNNPNTNSPWTQAEIQDLQIGIRSYIHYYAFGPNDVKCTQVWVVVDFAPTARSQAHLIS